MGVLSATLDRLWFEGNLSSPRRAEGPGVRAGMGFLAAGFGTFRVPARFGMLLSARVTRRTGRARANSAV
jgi:hypothetical protein